jgi:hypothetical protein
VFFVFYSFFMFLHGEGVDFLIFCSFFVFFHGEVNNII